MSLRTIKKLASIGFFAALVMLFIAFPILTQFEYRVQDAVFQEPGLLHPSIHVFGIDEHSLYTFGQWPWPRSVLAEAINILNTYEDERPAVIGIDAVFSEYGRFFPEEDRILADAVRNAGNVVLASHVQVGIDRDALTLEPVIVNYLTPISYLRPYVSYGLVNAIQDPDGTIRNALLWERVFGEVVYSFPAVIANKYLGREEPHQFVRDNASMFLRYTGMPGREGFNGDFFHMSIADVFEDWFDPWWFDGQIVLIGPYAIGMMDHYSVPIYHGAHMYGVEIHANAIQALLDEAFFLRMTPFASGLLVFLIILIGMLLGELVDYRIVLAIFAVFGAAYFFAVQHVYSNMFIVMPILAPLAALGVIAAYQTVYENVLQTIEKGKLKSTFQKYVDPKLVDVLVKSGEADSNQIGKKKDIAVVFVDVRGFTPMTESFRDTPELVVETLNAYLELTSKSVFNNGGSVDKFIGDATMALFNGFVPLDDYVYKAVKSAWDMVQGAGSVNKEIKERYGIDIGFGVGVHCGEAIVGNLGPSFRKDYTAIGDTVNTAARLESNAKRSQVLISRDVYDRLEGRIEAESVGMVPLKGKSVPLEIFALTGVN